MSVQKKEIIFISSIHRSSERFIDGLTPLKKDYRVIFYNISQASSNTVFEANQRYHEKQKRNFNRRDIFNASGLKNYGQRLTVGYCDYVCKEFFKLLNSKTACVIIDDVRTNKTPYIHRIYETVKNFNSKIPVIGIPEGIKPKMLIDSHYNLIKGRKKCYDDIFCFGKYDYDYVLSKNTIDNKNIHIVGIPENDKIASITNQNQCSDEYILFVVNFLKSYQHSKFDTSKSAATNKETIGLTGVIQLQKKLKKKIVFKLKHRMHENLEDQIGYLKSILPLGLNYEIVTNTDCDLTLIKDASVVLSYGSGMMLKALMMKKPTVIFREFGYVGMFDNYTGTVNLGENYDQIFKKNHQKHQNEFLINSLGVVDYFNAKLQFSDAVKKVIK